MENVAMSVDFPEVKKSKKLIGPEIFVYKGREFKSLEAAEAARQDEIKSVEREKINAAKAKEEETRQAKMKALAEEKVKAVIKEGEFRTYIVQFPIKNIKGDHYIIAHEEVENLLNEQIARMSIDGYELHSIIPITSAASASYEKQNHFSQHDSGYAYGIGLSYTSAYTLIGKKRNS